MNITVLVSSSPCAKHPGTDMIETTVHSIRHHLPNERIVIMQDGVRPEQRRLAEAYNNYVIRLVNLANENVSVMYQSDFRHQALTTLDALASVDSPLILFVEHDTPLMYREIDWEFLHNAIRFGIVNMVRLHYDEFIHPDHYYLMRGRLGTNLYKTIQWSQRPHLARTTWYTDLLKKHFTPTSRCFIEDKVYSPVVSAPWEEYKLAIYDPKGTGLDMKCSRDLNGRGAEAKYDQVFE